MTLFQAILIGLFAYLGSKRTPWFFGVTGGWNMIGRPLVAGLIVGIMQAVPESRRLLWQFL